MGVQLSLKDDANQQTSEDIDKLMRSAGIEGDAAEIREDLAELYRMNSKATSKGRIFTNANRKSRTPATSIPNDAKLYKMPVLRNSCAAQAAAHMTRW